MIYIIKKDPTNLISVKLSTSCINKIYNDLNPNYYFKL